VLKVDISKYYTTRPKGCPDSIPVRVGLISVIISVFYFLTRYDLEEQAGLAPV
jgi:hypothetical protein